MHVYTLHVCMLVHIMVSSVYKNDQNYFLLRIIFRI
jgi:hypothetical protein